MASRVTPLLGVTLLIFLSFSFVLASNLKDDSRHRYCNAETPEPAACTQALPKIFIQNGIVVNAGRKQKADVLIADGKIKEVGLTISEVPGAADTVIDASGKYVMPGGVDPHTHLELEVGGTVSQDDFCSGHAAALAGGTTMHIDFVMPTNGSYVKGVETYHAKAKGKACMDYAFHAQIIDWNEKIAEELDVMVKEKGISSFKFFTGLDFMIEDDEIIEGFAKCKSLGAVAMVHSETGHAINAARQKIFDIGITGVKGHLLSRPSWTEGEAVGRAIRLARLSNVPLFIPHVSSKDAVEEISKARELGQRVVAEPTPAALALNDCGYFDPDFDTAAKYVMSPPIRGELHKNALQSALSKGVLQVVGTDHCPYNTTQRRVAIGDFRKLPSGINGIEERMHIVWDTMVNSGLIGVKDYVRITSTNSAKIFNLYPRKGAIKAGSDADVIILNPDATFTISAKTHHSRSDTNVFEGMSGKGKVEITIAGGRVVWQNGQLTLCPGSGKYVERQPFGYMYKDIDEEDAAKLWQLLHAKCDAPLGTNYTNNDLAEIASS
ncbi:dihydropyrimidinase [Proteus mirabilis]|nr:dihydropyrimidinase [Proteus mirabilis]